MDTFSNAVENYGSVDTIDTEDTYRYVNPYDNLDAYTNFDRNSNSHLEGHNNLDSYNTNSETGHSTEVGQKKYKTMMSGMMTDMIKSTVSTAVDTVMESGSAKVTFIYYNDQVIHKSFPKVLYFYLKGGDDSVCHRLHTNKHPQLCLLLGLCSQVSFYFKNHHQQGDSLHLDLDLIDCLQIVFAGYSERDKADLSQGITILQ